jgi:hypothetical protein
MVSESHTYACKSDNTKIGDFSWISSAKMRVPTCAGTLPKGFTGKNKNRVKPGAKRKVPEWDRILASVKTV